MTDINVSTITELLNRKADRDLFNIDTSNGADVVVAYQTPTSSNNYTWFRIYKSGWVEQGGIITSGTAGVSVILPVVMANNKYTITYSQGGDDNNYDSGTDVIPTSSLAITGFIVNRYVAGVTSHWQVSGKGDPTDLQRVIHEQAQAHAGETTVQYEIADLADYIIGYQEPTSENNYKWYRVWKSGWVEQGQKTTTFDSTSTNLKVLSFSIKMANTHYSVMGPGFVISGYGEQFVSRYTDCIKTKSNIESAQFGYTGNTQGYEIRGQGDPDVIAQMIAESHISNSVNTYVTEMQLPTSTNDYTWYKKYSNGWVEQGGIKAGTYTCRDNVTINLPITMADTHYECQLTSNIYGDSWTTLMVKSKATANFVAYVWGPGSGDKLSGIHWRIEGMAATE